MLVIDPDECIDCGACVDECPVTAIFPEEDLPEKWKHFLELNAKYTPDWPVIDATKDPLPTAEDARNQENKFPDFDPSPGGD